MKIEFTTGNAAFDGDDSRWEIMCILLTIKNEVSVGYDHGVIMDVNGNKIGEWKI